VHVSPFEETGAPRSEVPLPVGCISMTKKHGFASMAQNTAKLAGSISAFAAICFDNFRATGAAGAEGATGAEGAKGRPGDR
jgi:hypothetical protein